MAYLRTLLIAALAVVAQAPASAATMPVMDARQILEKATSAMGGATVLSQLRALRFDARQLDYRIDDSERAIDPYWVRFRTIQEVRDVVNERLRQEATLESAQFVQKVTLIDDGRVSASGTHFLGKTYWSTRPSPHERMALSPERVLQTASHASDLRTGPDVMIHGVNHHHLEFTWDGFPVDLFVDADSSLPDRIDIRRTDPYDLVQTAWGDVSFRTNYLFWKRQPSGLYYPRQWDIFRNGQPTSTYEIVSLAENPDIAPHAFDIDAEAQAKFRATGHLSYGEYPLGTGKGDVLQPIGDNIWLLAGNWNVVVAKQSDGLVVIECPQSGGYSKRVLALLASRFPGVPIKAAISTTDSLWHFAGIRTYAARAIPIYALDLTLPLLRSFFNAPHRFQPDELALHPRGGLLRAVSRKTTVGSGDTGIEIYPIRGHGDERMLMVYFPKQRLLYGSSNDISSRGELLGTFNLPEIVTAVRRYRLSVNTYVAIHTAKMRWPLVMAIAQKAAMH